MPDEVRQIDVHEIYLKLCPLIEKAISSTKAGLTAFKKANDAKRSYSIFFLK